MQVWKILVAIAAVAAFPMAGAATPEGCDERPVSASDAIAHPFHKNRYLLLTAEGVQMWTESNGVPKLQTVACTETDGTVHYVADTLDDGVVLL